MHIAPMHGGFLYYYKNADYSGVTSPLNEEKSVIKKKKCWICFKGFLILTILASTQSMKEVQNASLTIFCSSGGFLLVWVCLGWFFF